MKLIDFGSFNFITNDGFIAGSDGVSPDLFKTKVYEDTSRSASERFLKTFLSDNCLDTKNLMDNPYLKTTSNASNFEFRTLYTHLLDGSEKNPLEFFKGYLQQKAEQYHTKLKAFLETLSFDKIAANFSEEKIKEAESRLKQAITYEDLINTVLSNPDDSVVKTELAKLQLRTFLNTGDSLGSPAANSKKLKAAYEQLISMLQDGIKNSEGRKKEYFEETLKSFIEKFKGFEFEAGQIEIPDNENLIKVFFTKASGIIQNITKPAEIKKGIERTVNEPKIVTRNTKNIGAVLALSAAIIAGIFLLTGKKDKKSAVIQNIPKSTSNNALTNKTAQKEYRILSDNNFKQNLPEVFTAFKK